MNTPSRTFWKSALWILGALAALFVLVFLSAYFYLKSPGASQYLLSRAQTYLAQNYQIQMEFQSCKWEPLSSLHFKNLKFSQKSSKTQPNAFQVEIQSLDLEYRFSWFPQSFFVKGEMHLSDSTPLLFSRTPVSGNTPQAQFKTRPSATAKWEISFFKNPLGSPHSSQWHLDFNLLDLTWSLNEVSAQAEDIGKSSNLHLDLVKVDAQAKISLNTSDPRTFSDLSFDLATGKGTLQTGPMRLQQTEKGKKTQQGYKSHLTTFNLELNPVGVLPVIDAKLDSMVQDWILSPKPLSTATLELSSNFEIPPSLKSLTGTGKLSVKTSANPPPTLLDFTLKSQFEKIVHLQGKFKLTQAPYGEWTADSQLAWDDPKLTGTTVLSHSKNSLPFQFLEPIHLTHEIHLLPDHPEFYLEAKIPSVEVKIPNDSPVPTKTVIKDIHTQLRAAQEGENRFILKELSAELGQSLLKLTAEATGDTKTQNFQSHGSLDVSIPKSLSLSEGNLPFSESLRGQTLTGHMEIPWNISVYHGREISFDGVLKLFALNWTKTGTKNSPASLHIAGIRGRVPVSERLVWDGKHIRFTHLITQNPFERVDFERLQPLIQESEEVDIQEIGWEEKKYGPFQGYFSFRQNMILAHRVDFKLNDGRAYGEMYFDTYPLNLQLGMLLRLTQLNITEILPKKHLVQATSSSPTRETLSGRSGLVINLNNGSMDGRVDITEISSNQMITLLNVLDPKYENEQMNKARFGLGIAQPSNIQMAFEKGYMNFGVKLDKPISQTFEVRAIPVSVWISDASSDVVKQARKF